METGYKLVSLGIDEHYEPEITGFGDIYEAVSVRITMKRLKRRYGAGTVYLCSNPDHGGRGLTLEALEEHVRGTGGEVTEKGFVDIPPWRSKPRTAGTKNPLIQSALLTRMAVLVSIVVVAFERFAQDRKKAHMVYCFSKAKRSNDQA